MTKITKLPTDCVKAYIVNVSKTNVTSYLTGKDHILVNIVGFVISQWLCYLLATISMGLGCSMPMDCRRGCKIQYQIMYIYIRRKPEIHVLVPVKSEPW